MKKLVFSCEITIIQSSRKTNQHTSLWNISRLGFRLLPTKEVARPLLPIRPVLCGRGPASPKPINHTTMAVSVLAVNWTCGLCGAWYKRVHCRDHFLSKCGVFVRIYYLKKKQPWDFSWLYTTNVFFGVESRSLSPFPLLAANRKICHIHPLHLPMRCT